MRSDQEALCDRLHIAWLRRLTVGWHHYNEEYLDGVLRLPIIALSDAGAEWGCWDLRTRQIRISARHIEHDPWLIVMETLRHEMAHQYVDEHMHVLGERPHGSAFQEACRRLRCEKGKPGAVPPEDERVLRVLKKILFLASSPNEHEAESAVKKAQCLLLQYNLDMVELDQSRSFAHRCIGPIKSRRASFELWLGMILQEFFFVEVLWAKTYDASIDKAGSILQIYGTPTNLEMANYVYDYLCHLVQRLWRQYRAEQQLQGDRERQRYCAGVLEGFYHKLVEQRDNRQQENALVWRGDVRLSEYYRHINPKVVTTYGRGVRKNSAYNDGLSAGRQVELRRPLAADAGSFGGLLEAK